MELLFSRADVRGVAHNADYPHQVSIAEGDTAALEALCRFDHVGAIYKNNHRSRKNFIRANVLMMDCDNDGSEDPAAWLIPDTITARYPDLIFYAVPSKSHMKEKRNGQTDKYFSPRPRHHYYYPLSCEILSESDLSALKEKFLALFPQFDDGAKDSARFFYGVEDPHATFYPGTKTIDECLLDVPDPEDKKSGEGTAKNTTQNEHPPVKNKYPPVIKLGTQHKTLLSEALAILKHYGNTPDAVQKFKERVKACESIADMNNVYSIWNDAIAFYEKSILTDPKYIPPSEYESRVSKKPIDPAGAALYEYAEKAIKTGHLLTDPDIEAELHRRGARVLNPRSYRQGQASVIDFEQRESLYPRITNTDDVTEEGESSILAAKYHDALKCIDGLWYGWTGQIWQTDRLTAGNRAGIAALKELTQRQQIAALADAAEAKAEAAVHAQAAAEAAKNDNKELALSEKAAQEKYEDRGAYFDKLYKNLAMFRQCTHMNHVLTLAAVDRRIGGNGKRYLTSMDLNSNGDLLACPSCCVDLRTGVRRENRRLDLLTVSATVDPTTQEDDPEAWRIAEDFFLWCANGDQELSDYLKSVFGICIRGELCEKLFCFSGEGGNGKSTLTAVYSLILGSMSVDRDQSFILTAQDGKGQDNRFARDGIDGARLIVISETKQGAYVLNTGTIKDLLTFKPMHIEEKNRHPRDTRPQYALILTVNNLPEIPLSDINAGTQRRLVRIPFDNCAIGLEKENYAKTLYEKAGGAFLQMAIDGAKRFYDADCREEAIRPQAVRNATAEWFKLNVERYQRFVDEYCEVGPDKAVNVQSMQNAFFMATQGNTSRTVAAVQAFESGMSCVVPRFRKFRKKTGMVYLGVSLKE